jgi:hypothetical protein
VTARDDARTHPSLDELADHREGLLPPADEARVGAHLDGCRDCAGAMATLDDVAVALRDAGAEPVTMPDSVARSIGAALAQAAANGAQRPTAARNAPEPTRARHRWVKPAFGWLAGTAAAVVVIGGIGAGLNNLGSGSDDSAAGGNTSAAADRPGPESSPTGGHAGSKAGTQPELKRVSPDNLSDYARAFALESSAPRSTYGYDARNDSAYAARCPSRGIGGLRQPVIWEGAKAVMVVRRGAKVASVYSCDATPRLLYSAPY